MTVKLGVVMDPIASIAIKKDSTFAMLLEAQARGWEVHYMEQRDLWLRDGRLWANLRRLSVQDDPRHHFDLQAAEARPLEDLQVILMRKDPPFDMEYIYTTYLLEMAEQQGVLVVNKPQGLRDANEKLASAWFPQCTPPTLVTRRASLLREFLHEHRQVVLKPLDGMGGTLVFHLNIDDPNTNVIIETLTNKQSRYTMAQQFIPEIQQGDKRILLVDGEPIPHALARIPAEGESRGNLAVGATARGIELSQRDRWICQQVGPTLRDRGLLFVGLDVIGDYLTEVNVTSPTCIRELDQLFSINISKFLLDRIQAKLAGPVSA
jgi:glutathione synthase